MIYNKYGALNEPLLSACTKIGEEAGEKMKQFCQENDLSMEETTIAFFYMMMTLNAYDCEIRLRKGMALRKEEKKARTQRMEELLDLMDQDGINTIKPIDKENDTRTQRLEELRELADREANTLD